MRFLLRDTEDRELIGIIKTSDVTTKHQLEDLICDAHEKAREQGEYDSVVLTEMLPADCTVMWFEKPYIDGELEW